MFCEKCQSDIPDKKIPNHWLHYHDGEEDYSVRCPECSIVYHTRSTFYKHWYKNHHERKNRNPVAPSAKRICHDASAEAMGEQQQSSSEILVDSSSLNVHADGGSSACVHQVPSPNDRDSSVGDGVGVSDVGKVIIPSGSVQRAVETVSSSGEGKGNDSSSSDSENDSDKDSDSDSGVPLSELFRRSSAQAKPSKHTETNPAASSFLINLRDKCSVPDSRVSSMLSETEMLVQSAVHEFSNKVKETLKTKGIDLENVMNVEESVHDASNVFKNLKTIKAQNKHFENKYRLVNPVKIPLGRELKKRRGKSISGMKVVAVGQELIFVPLKKVVDKLVNHPDFDHFVEEGKRARDSPFLDSYMKGERCKRNEVLKDHPDALRFVLYYDDLEACSPLKSKAGNHKIGAFYLYIENVPIKYRSKLSSIILVALVNANHISGKKYGIDAGLEHITTALQEFENGVMLPSGKFTFGTLIAVIGDNKGSNAVGGFKEGFTAHRPCRFCFATLEQLRQMTEEDRTLLRDIQSYTQQCDKVQTAKGKNEKLSKEYGINRDSILNTLSSYHVVGGLPPDAMHDLLEGALPLTIRKLLKHYLYDCKEKIFTLDWLNCAIENFDYGYAEVSSKPSPMKKEYIEEDDNNTKIHQSASQVWVLATILPLIIGPLVNTDDKYFANFLDILEICRIVFSVEIPRWMVSYLSDLIETYLVDYVTLYGALIPKQHHLLHYPYIILEMGSMFLYMCMRMEAKHKYFKSLVNVLGSYKNIFWTLAVRHQVHQAVEWSKSLKHASETGPCSKIVSKNCAFQHLLPSDMSSFVETTWLSYNGNKFKSGGECFLCVGYDEEAGPKFVRVDTVIVHPSVVFICHKVLTVRRDIQLASYEVKVMEDLLSVSPGEMMYHSVLHAHIVGGKLFIAFKYCAGGEVL